MAERLVKLGFLYLSDENAPPSEEWTITFGKKDIDETFYSVQQTTDGGYVVTGYVYENDNQEKLNIHRPVDGWVMKLRSEGAK